jgi:hypothetical protein
VERAYWLTTKVETGATFGTVVAYDGTGMTAGPDQHIAVYPSELAAEDYNAVDDQGGLWKLLRRMEVAGESPADYYHTVGALWDYFKKSMGAYVAQDGVLRYVDKGTYQFPGGKVISYPAGSLVFGHHIRAALTPSAGPDPGVGQVPKSGKEWDTAAIVAELFHQLMVHPNGRQIQVEFGKEHLVNRTNVRRETALMGVYGLHELTSLRVGVDGWSEEMDLALSVYQSHSVNAPAIATKWLKDTWLRLPKAGPEFAKALIAALGHSTFGQWNENLPSGRYQRTRTAALNVGLWSRSLFEGPQAIMPKDLPG